MKFILALLFILTTGFVASSQNIEEAEIKNKLPTQIYSYAYITIQGKAFGKKLIVDVDLGDAPEQINAGKSYSEALTNKRSYAAILNHMSENYYELVESRDYSFSYQGTGGTYGIILIMRKKIKIKEE